MTRRAEHFTIVMCPAIFSMHSDLTLTYTIQIDGTIGRLRASEFERDMEAGAARGELAIEVHDASSFPYAAHRACPL